MRFVSSTSTGSLNFYLLCTAVLLSFYDTVSTVLSARAVDYSYEGNIIIREIIHRTGVLGFAGVKFSVTLLALLLAYYIIQHKVDLGWENVKMFYGIYAGTAVSSFFVATSNLSVVYAGSSFYFLDLNSLHIGLLLLFIAPMAGFLLDIKSSQKDSCT
jgi:hypothetical protein